MYGSPSACQQLKQEKKNRRLSKETVKCFYQRFCRDKLRSKSSQNTTVSSQVPSGLRPSSLLKEQAYLQYHNEVLKPFCTFRHSSTAKEGKPCILKQIFCYLFYIRFYVFKDFFNSFFWFNLEYFACFSYLKFDKTFVDCLSDSDSEREAY